MIDNEQLRTFAVFAEELSFTRAAGRLHLSQPAVHAQVQKLAAALEVTLYQRQGRRLLLTAQGVECLSFAREQAARLAALRARLTGEADEQPVVLAAGEGAYLYLLGDAIAAFLRPGSRRLRLLTRDRAGTLGALTRGEAQLGVTSLAAVPPELEGRAIAQVPQVVALPRGHALARKRRLRPADLAGEALVLPPPGRPHREAVAGVLAAADVESGPIVEADGWPLMLHFVRLGLGVAVVNGCCRAPAGVLLRPLAGMAPLRYQLLRRRGAARSTAQEALWQLIAERSRFRAS